VAVAVAGGGGGGRAWRSRPEPSPLAGVSLIGGTSSLYHWTPFLPPSHVLRLFTSSIWIEGSS